MSAAAPLPCAELAAAVSDEAWRDLAKARLADGDAALARRFDAGEDVERLVRERARLADELLVSAWDRCLGEAPLTLLATGGFGRGELFPQSDIDLLVLGDEAAQKAHAADLSRYFALLWDAGLPSSQAVRSRAQCREAALADIATATALLEVRVLAGAAKAAACIAEVVAAGEIWPPADFFSAKREEQRARHARFNDTAYNLEPNLKEGPGGLRDLHTLVWLARRLYGVPTLDALVPLGALGEDECATLAREKAALSRLRFGLHLVAGRREERLLFDYQKSLAARFGLKDEHRENLAVEQLMQGFFRSAATVLRINDRLLQRFEEQIEGAAEPLALDPGFESRRGYLAMQEPTALAGQFGKVLRLFAVWAEHPELRGLHSETARALAEALPALPDYDSASPAHRAAFLALLRGPNAVATVARMARLGVLGRYLPAFARVSGRMQYDLFHVYTVDEHTLAVLRNIESLADPARCERFALGHEVWNRLRRPELLLLAGLFHDIAKGRGGDHSVLGEQDALDFCRAHALAAADGQLVAWLVRHHLLMSVTAQRQDISDPDVVKRFATTVGDREHLDLLYLLTVCDIAGTSPKLWNAWKDRLLADLYAATRFALRRGLEHPVFGPERIAETREAARMLLRTRGMREAQVDAVWAEFPDESFLRYRPEQLVWQTEGIAARRNANEPLVRVRPLGESARFKGRALEVFVYSPDRDGLFAAVTASLDRLELDVLAARVVTSTRGMSLDTFQVLAPERLQLEPEALARSVERRLFEVLSRSLDRVRPARRTLPRHFRHFRVPVQVDVARLDNDRTQLTLVCTDRPGLLADVAQTLRQQGLRVHDARIATFGERVEDFFLLSDEHNHALGDPERLQALRAALVACVDGQDPQRKPESHG